MAAVSARGRQSLRGGRHALYELSGFAPSRAWPMPGASCGDRRRRSETGRGPGNPGADPGHHRGGHPGVRPHRDDPQSYHAFGGFKVQGKGRTGLPPCWPTRWPSRPGAFAVVLECVPPKLAALVTRKLDIITIGIGAGAGRDGRVWSGKTTWA